MREFVAWTVMLCLAAAIVCIALLFYNANHPSPSDHGQQNFAADLVQSVPGDLVMITTPDPNDADIAWLILEKGGTAIQRGLAYPPEPFSAKNYEPGMFVIRYKLSPPAGYGIRMHDWALR